MRRSTHLREGEEAQEGLRGHSPSQAPYGAQKLATEGDSYVLRPRLASAQPSELFERSGFEAPNHNGTVRRVISPSLGIFLDSGQSWRHCSLALQIEGDAMDFARVDFESLGRPATHAW